MHHWQKSYLESHSEDAHLYEKRELCLINLKVLRGELGFLFPSFFLLSINSSSCTLSETIGKWVLLMWAVRILWGGIITDKTPKMKICIPLWPSVVNCNIKEMVPCVTFSAKKNFWFVYTRLHLSVTGLYSFTIAKSLVCVFRIDPVQGWKRKHFVEYFEAEIKQYALNRD